MFPVAKPRIPVTACRLGLRKAVRKLAASTSPTDPNRHRATNGSLKVRIETRRRTTTRNNHNQQQQRQRDNNAMKKKNT
jgi:hypothetical protein